MKFNTERIITSCNIYEEDGVRIVSVIYDDGIVSNRFIEYDPETINITEEELIGLTIKEAWALESKKYEEFVKKLMDDNLI